MTLQTSGPNLGLLIGGDEGDEHYIDLMKQWRGFDLLIQSRVLDKDLSAPPGSPADGAAYIVAGSATGAWASHSNQLARWSTVAAAWEFFVPKAGWETFVADESLKYRYSGSAWVASGSSAAGGAFQKEFALSDLSTALTTGTTKGYWRPTFAAINIAARISVLTTSTSGDVVVIPRKNGSTSTSASLTIPSGQFVSPSQVEFGPTSQGWAVDDLIEFDITSAGTGAKGLIITLTGTYA